MFEEENKHYEIWEKFIDKTYEEVKDDMKNIMAKPDAEGLFDFSKLRRLSLIKKNLSAIQYHLNIVLKRGWEVVDEENG